MRILINALSVTNLSGRHVLLGHFARVARWTVDRHRYVFLYHRANRDIRRDLGPNVEWVECPGYTADWVGRAVWERGRLAGIVRRHRIEAVFSPAGTVTAGLDMPQVSFAQNPWCLVAAVPKNRLEEGKAALQRRAYRQAMRQARVMVFNSAYMRRAYRKNAGFAERDSAVIHQALDDATHRAAARNDFPPRKPFQVLAVSVMAPHKDIETLVCAVWRVRTRHRVPAELVLAGPWADQGYRDKIETLVTRKGLADAVRFTGRVASDRLHRLYAASRVFCLMSRCESFGIPAVEAQAFGTPVVSSNCCAIPEVCGKGGIFPDPGDVAGTAHELARLLTNDEEWGQFSEAARANAAKYRWETCSRPFLEVFGRLEC